MLLIYGASGYAGGIVARAAAEAGLAPILAGRRAEPLEDRVAELDVEGRVFSLDDPAAIDEALRGVSVVLNAAAPFAVTQAPLLRGCLTAGATYLDLAGEVPELASAHARGAQARARGVMLMPGVGFNVVPTDAVAWLMHRRVPDARRLRLAYYMRGRFSRGALGTLIADLDRPGVVRVRGELCPERAAIRSLDVPLGDDAVHLVSNPWRADLLSAFVTTGIPDIEVYSHFPAPLPGLMRRPHLAHFARAAFRQAVRLLPEGPTGATLDEGASYVWGAAEDDYDGRASARLTGPSAYRFTALTAVAIARRALSGDAPPGFQTPAGAYGGQWVFELPGVTLEEGTP